MITIIAEPAKKAGSQEKLVSIFRKLKEVNPELEINLKIAKRTDSMRGYSPRDEEILIVFGAKLYQHILEVGPGVPGTIHDLFFIHDLQGLQGCGRYQRRAAER